MEKLPIQDIFGESFYIWGHLFSLGQICVGTILNSFSGANFFWGAIFFVGENQLNLCFSGKFYLWGLF